MKRVLIVDDHQVLRRGLRDLLAEANRDIDFGEAGDAPSLAAALAAGPWDLLVLDIMVPGLNVMDVIADVRSRFPALPILILTAIAEPEFAVRTAKAGAHGYVNKQQACDELVIAAQRLMAGGRYLSQEVVDALEGDMADAGAPHERLSKREYQIFVKIAEGQTPKQIAFDLSLSAKTVATHLAHIREKTGLSTYASMAAYAVRASLL